MFRVRSLLEGSDTISIDTSVVSSQEFGCLLDMVYTGKLPVGKHNVSRIVAAADSLQMFDVAVGFKKVLTTLVKQQPPVQAASGQTQTPTPTLKSETQNPNPELSPPTGAAHTSFDSAELKKEQSESEHEDGEEHESKRTRLEPSESTGENQLSSQLPVDVKNIKDVIELMFYHRDANFFTIRTFSRTNGVDVVQISCMCLCMCVQSLKQPRQKVKGTPPLLNHPTNLRPISGNRSLVS